MYRNILPAVLSFTFAALAQDAKEPPVSWVDPDTGHRVVRLTTEPGSASLYFNQNGYTSDGKGLVYTTPNGISVLDLESRKTRKVVEGRVRLIDVGRKTPSGYYIKEGAVYSTRIDNGDTHKIPALPARGSIATVNADETPLAGTYIEGDARDYNNNRSPAGAASQQTQQNQGHPLDQPRNKGQMMEERLAARLPMAMFTVER